MWELLFLLLPLAAWTGWWMAHKRLSSPTRGTLPSDYYLGLKHLLNEQTEMAVAAFSRMLDSSPETVETSLALGALFRRRGEVDRAIHVHEELLKRQDLSLKQREQTMFALGEDYLHAGVLDRAETLFCQLAKEESALCARAQWHLLTIFEQEKDWDKAIDCALQIEKDPLLQRDKSIAQYFCEKAELAKVAKNETLLKECVENALHVDKNCVRASLLYGDLLRQQSLYQEAIRAYARLERQDPDFIPEMVGRIAHCYEHLGAETALMRHLEELLSYHPSSTLLLLYARYLQQVKGEEAAAAFVTEFVQKHPSIRGIGHLVAYHMRRATASTRSQLLLLQGLMERLLAKRPVYQCGVCGFASKLLHWQCPSCKQWATIKPIVGLEGE